MKETRAHKMLRLMQEQWKERGVDLAEVGRKAMALEVETPSWAYGNCGTRFGVVKDPAAPRNAFEKVADAAQVHRFTGVTPAVALHIEWDRVPDWSALQTHARSLGIRIGAINPNVFSNDIYRYGSVCSPDARVRRAAVAHMKECVDIAKEVGSPLFTPWFADGTNYPGQGDFRRRKERMLECMKEVYAYMPRRMRMLIEYKLFEPAFYHTDLADWGAAFVLCRHLGERAQVLIDLGHHAHGTNIEYIVAYLIAEGRMGGFHFNDRKYADDDLTTGCIDPYQLFRIFNELAAGWEDLGERLQVAFMIDEMPVIKPRIESMIQSAMNIQETYARSLLVNRRALREAQDENRIIDAERILREAYSADVSPILEAARMERGLDPDPLAAFRRSGYYGRALKERSGGKKRVESAL